MSNTFPLSKIIDGYLLSLHARHLSPNTIIDYTRTLTKFAAFLVTDPPVTDITSRYIEQFLASFPNLSNKSLLNHYIALSALWTWMVREEFVKENIVKRVTAPKPIKKDIQPLTEAEIRAIMGALHRSRVYRRAGVNVDHELDTMERNRVIILLMLDTGIRASELCGLKIADVDNRNSRIFVKHGKGEKERTLPISSRTAQAVWRYISGRKDTRPDDPLIATRTGRPMTRGKLSETFAAIGRRAGVAGLHPHKLRHTFAIMFLRNGGDAYTLQSMLGHSSLDTVRIYLRLAQVDLDNAHRRASPVDNLRL